ncbi:hypothetical protein [Rhodococcus jostii]|uniref:Uncharacterized protein n=1 Tax=Rhodococcus jostii TaxID=132919 RepID=A0A1H4XUJ4_RHOJO|nr:hypothetical protein [Rhodococcus jostii]SED08404.1 hypothetical protein SAMN04490220_3449 [Rhodococcus jostii]
MSENNAGMWEPVRPASNLPGDDNGSAVAWNAARQAPYVQPQGPNPFAQPASQAQAQAQAQAATPARPQTQAPAAPVPQQAPATQQAPPQGPFTPPQPQQQFAPQQPANRPHNSNADQPYAVSARDLSTSLLLKCRPSRNSPGVSVT